MPVGTINFERCLQNTHIMGTDEEYMASRVYFSIEAGGGAAQTSADLQAIRAW